MNYFNSDHLQLKDIDVSNKKAYVERPDPNFSARRNYQIIHETLKENAKWQKAADTRVMKNAEDRVDIIVSYGRYRLGSGGTKKLEKYVGRDWMKKIYGEKLMSKLRVMESTIRLNKQKGNTLYGGAFYLPGQED